VDIGLAALDEFFAITAVAYLRACKSLILHGQQIPAKLSLTAESLNR
jgi:hypothetical protein